MDWSGFCSTAPLGHWCGDVKRGVDVVFDVGETVDLYVYFQVIYIVSAWSKMSVF
jgi:hypothetical protein